MTSVTGAAPAESRPPEGLGHRRALASSLARIYFVMQSIEREMPDDLETHRKGNARERS